MSISRIGIIGAGQIGNGITYVIALADYEVIMQMFLKNIWSQQPVK